MQTPEWLKPGIWGGVIGAVAITIIGFSADWVVVSSTAEEMAESRAEAAVAQALTPVCVAKFKELSTERETKQLAALEKEGTWGADDYVAEQGWATFASSQGPNDEVADACAEELLKLAAKTDQPLAESAASASQAASNVASADDEPYASARDCLRSVGKIESQKETQEGGLSAEAKNLLGQAQDLCMRSRYEQVQNLLGKVTQMAGSD